MSVDRREVATSGLLLVMSTFPVLIGQAERKGTKSKEKGGRRDKINHYKRREEKETQKKTHNITSLAT
jgi:hypothetical protein